MAEITLSDITNATTGADGTGAFDVLQNAVELHISEQWELGRLTGKDYATVYLGALQQVLQTATQFALTKQDAARKADLTSAQVSGQLEQTLLIQQQRQTEAEQTSLVQQQILKEIQETALVTEQIAKTVTEKRAVGFESQAKLDKQFGFLIAQNVTNAWDMDNITAGTDGLIDEQIAEIAARVSRENAMNTEKIALVQAQTLGFKTDTKQKVLRQIMESWSVIYSVSPATLPPNRLTNTAIDDVIEDVLNDVGFTYPV